MAVTLHTYTDTEWKNAPDHKTTPLNATNLNNIETGMVNVYGDLADVYSEQTTEDGKRALKTDLASISETGSTASQAISEGTFFYLDGVLVTAKTAIAGGATFTENTNYEVVTAGALNSIKGSTANNYKSGVSLTSYTSAANKYTFPQDGYVHIQSTAHAGNSVGMMLYGASGDVSILKTATLARDYVFVRKGMRAYFTITGADNYIMFYGLE